MIDINAMLYSVLQGLAISFTLIPWWLWGLLVAVAMVNILFANPKHIMNIWASRKHLKALRAMNDPRRQFIFLRQLDPFVFEEVILTALKDLGHGITRNKRYTGDGGIDGKAVIGLTPVVIQAKRYKGHISKQHVDEFDELCKRNRINGLFVHTGRTGKGSRQYTQAGRVDIISGQRLLDLLNGKEFNPRW